MAIMAKCDRCGFLADTDGRVRGARPRRADRGHGVAEPVGDEAVERPVRHLCPECVNALRKFFQGDGEVPGLLSVETLEGIGEGTCPQPQEPRPLCPVHERVELEAAAPDPRPTLTERARKLAGGEKSRHCTCAGAGFGTEDCAVHHPEGLEQGTHLKRYQDPDGRECPGLFRRGMFREHMERWHGIPVAEGSVQCPFCPTIEPGWKLGAHIAAEHPGDWQAWIDGGSARGCSGAACSASTWSGGTGSRSRRGRCSARSARRSSRGGNSGRTSRPSIRETGRHGSTAGSAQAGPAAGATPTAPVAIPGPLACAAYGSVVLS